MKYNEVSKSVPTGDEKSVTEYFHVIIAGKKVEIECGYRNVFYRCKKYLAKFETPDIVINMATREEIDRQRASEEAEGRDFKNLSLLIPKNSIEASLETMVVCRKLAEALLPYGFLLFHGAAIAADGKCYLFMAKSGVGKTTHINKWLRLHPDTFVVNGDKPLIDINNLTVYGTPWCGKENLGTNTNVPLSGLVWLERGIENEIKPISFSEIFPCLIQQCHIPDDGASAVNVMHLLNKLQKIPCWRLKCNMDDSAGELSYSTLVLQN